MLPVLPPLRDRDLSPAQRATLAASSLCDRAEETSRSLLPSTLLGILAGALAFALLSAIRFDLWSGSGVALLAFGLPLACASLIWQLRRQVAMRLNALPLAEREHVSRLAHKAEEWAAVHAPARRQRR
jgi:hypothetical protein